MTISKTLLFSALAVCVMALPASAALVQPDSGTTDGGFFGGAASDYAIANLLNEGFTSSADLADGSLGNVDYTYASANPPTGGFPVTVTLDFNSPQILDTFYLWNISHPSAGGPRDRGVRDFSLTFFDGAGGGGSQVGAVVNATAAQGPGGGVDIPSQTFALGSTYANVSSVELSLIDNYNANASWIGLREVAFNAIPEPTSAALLLGGVFGLLSARRRRR